MEELWTMFCGESGSRLHVSAFMVLPASCISNALIISFEILLLVLVLLFTFMGNASSSNSCKTPLFQRLSCLQLVSAIFNGFLGVMYLCLGFSMLEKTSRTTQTIFPLNNWLPMFLHGFTWLFVGVTVSIRANLQRTLIHLLSILIILYAAIICPLSLLSMPAARDSMKIVFGILCFLAAVLLMLCAYIGYNHENIDERDTNLLDPLNHANGIYEIECSDLITPFSKSGFINSMSFWWLNPLMKKGKERTLEEEDIPKLRKEDEAESCYTMFMEQFNKQKEADPSILKTIILCHWKEVVVSGFFALLKILTLSAGPLILNSFILIAEGKQATRNGGHGYFLALMLFLSKIVESLSQRQWYFRSRLIGLKVRSLLASAVYRKQLRLSNAGRLIHTGGEILNYVTVDAYRIGEFPFWLHQTWTTSLQLCFSLVILFRAVGLATVAALVVIIVTVLCNAPLAKLQLLFQSQFMVAQDERLKACTEALTNMKVLKLYAWETHFRNVVDKLRALEYKWLSAVHLQKAYNGFLFWSSPVLVSASTFGACYLLKIPLRASNVFSFIATLRLVQEPIRSIPDVIGVVIQAKVAFSRIERFLAAPELQNSCVRKKGNMGNMEHSVLIRSADFSWAGRSSKSSLRNINLEIRAGEKVAVCGEVGSGKSTLLAAILGEIPNVQGNIEVFGSIAYVSQSAWIQTGTIRENILFGLPMDAQQYQDTLERCSLVKDLELLPNGDLTEIGERGVNLSGGQKQRIQLARALYQDADIYLLDDPFSAVDAETAASLFNDYAMGALARKSVLLVTHQVDFLPAFDSVLLMADGEILHAASYYQLLASCREFQVLVYAHKETAGSRRPVDSIATIRSPSSAREISKNREEKKLNAPKKDQLIKKEERGVGDVGYKPYIQYLIQNKGYIYVLLATFGHLMFVIGQISQNVWMAASVDNPHVGTLRLIAVYLIIGLLSTIFLLCRSIFTVVLGLQSSKSLFTQLFDSLFRAPMSFYDSTPLGRIISRVSSDLNIVDLDVPFSIIFTVGSTINAYSNLCVLAFVAWQVLFASVPMIVLAIRLQRYYFASAKELARINAATKSLLANHMAESIAGAMTIRAFRSEDRFFAKNLKFLDMNAGPSFHGFAASEWLIQRLEMLSAVVLASLALCTVLLPYGTFSPGIIGMALSYGISMNMALVMSIQNQCTLANYIVSMERLDHYMHIPSEAPMVVEDNRPPASWPNVGEVDIRDLQVRYGGEGPLVLRGISCRVEGGQKIGVVGRTGSGKSTLIGALFRLVEPAGGTIAVDGIDISKIGLNDLRPRLGIIPQDPTLFHGTVRSNLDPSSQHTDQEIWEVLRKCQLRETVLDKEHGLFSFVEEDGANWSMGQRQLFCLGRALLRRSKILVLDEATASVDTATDLIVQKTIRAECASCTVITVAHRLPTVMDCGMILTLSQGKMVEYDKPSELMKREGSLFGLLVKQYYGSHS